MILKMTKVCPGSQRSKLSKRVSVVPCVCDSRKKYETRVSNRMKENVNKILVIGTLDFKMMYELLKDADAFHKEKFDGILQNVKLPITPEKKTEDEETNENIFLEEKKN